MQKLEASAIRKTKIRKLYNNGKGMTTSELALKFGLTRQRIDQILKEKTK
jgi:DNA-directed RNA polymerase sigma subunit (sigma70/sigma32)